ncbi:merozoite surface protein 7 (MSP7), putative [Plasmodium malariae]|uniref:Merozoite surface protein 7 (MSP7), putative n=1 Tax=Plasmodium malariae TaxID=5858 RepID=A0A1A8WVG4_PLAMA|nr:merozoite surface protein 7 (MSP7), putative [Plasmodium malariae]
MKGNVKIYLFLFFLFYVHHVSSDNKSNLRGKNYNLDGYIVDVLQKKLGNIHNIGQNNASDSFNKKLEILKKQIEKIQKYETEYGGKGYEDILDSEFQDESGKKKKKIFGMDEDDLDNYDEDFLGQSAKGGQHATNSANGDVTSTQLTNDQSTEQVNGQSSSETAVAAAEQLDQKVNTDGSLPNNQTLATSTSSGSSPTNNPSASGGSGAQDERSENSELTPENAQNSSEKGQEGTPQTLPSSPTASNPSIQASTSGNSIPGKVANESSKVKHLDKIYDDLLETSETKNEIDQTPYHTKYNDFKREYDDFTMNDKEYDMVKKLFQECFKNGAGEGSNTTCLIDVFKKALEDNIFRKKFENFMNGIYSFAKRHNYLNDERISNEEQYNALLKNALTSLNTL